MATPTGSTTVALSAEECRHRLRGGGRGHVAITVGALPAVVPVGYELLAGDLILTGTDVTATPLPSVDGIVAFAAEAPDGAWSVLVVGPAAVLPGDSRLRLATDRVSGRADAAHEPSQPSPA